MTDPITHPLIGNRHTSLFSPLATKQVPREHPRIFGSRADLQKLAKERPEAYRITKSMVNRPLVTEPNPAEAGNDHGLQLGIQSKLMSMALVCAIEQDAVVGRQAIDFVFEHFINKPVKVGHEVFGTDAGKCGVVYDLCHEHWTEAEKLRFHAFLFECRDKNVDEELSSFHDGWFGYKCAGFIIALMAVMYETEKELYMMTTIDREFRTMVADALKLAGDGGAYAEGHYVIYYLYWWLLACDVMRNCTGADYMALVPEFYRQRAIASVFEQYPGIRERGSRRSAVIGDGGNAKFMIHRDRELATNRMLVARYRDDPAHQAMNTYLLQTPHVGAAENAFLELLWFDPTVPRGDLKNFKLSHLSKGPGFVYARSSWEEDATWLFFKCGNRFTSHQHLDVGHFFIVKYEELAGEGGFYDDFGGVHGSNYYPRSIAHNTMLVHDPSEVFAMIRAYSGPTFNDGGQAYPWPGTCFGHNGDAMDPDSWRRHPELGLTGEMLAFQDDGKFFYVAGDCTRAYSSAKLEWFTRQIVFIRPGTIVIFDRVKSKNPAFKKTWVMHAAKPPSGSGRELVVTHGEGRLHLQSLLPLQATVTLNQGDDLYRYGGHHVPPGRKLGGEIECRIEISATEPALEDCFLHVLTATHASVAQVARATAQVSKNGVTVQIGDTVLSFQTDGVGGSIDMGGKRTAFATRCQER